MIPNQTYSFHFFNTLKENLALFEHSNWHIYRDTRKRIEKDIFSGQIGPVTEKSSSANRAFSEIAKNVPHRRF